MFGGKSHRKIIELMTVLEDGENLGMCQRLSLKIEDLWYKQDISGKLHHPHVVLRFLFLFVVRQGSL